MFKFIAGFVKGLFHIHSWEYRNKTITVKPSYGKFDHVPVTFRRCTECLKREMEDLRLKTRNQWKHNWREDKRNLGDWQDELKKG